MNILTIILDSLGAGEITGIITAVITALTGGIVAIINAVRQNDRKKGRTHCSITGCELKPKKPRQKKPKDEKVQ